MYEKLLKRILQCQHYIFSLKQSFGALLRISTTIFALSRLQQSDPFFDISISKLANELALIFHMIDVGYCKETR